METDRQPYRPLYTQIQDALVRRIVEGEWRPGELLPSEQALALQLGVSQGTIRKAMDALEAEKIIDRRQGKGTFVAELTQEQSVYRFFGCCVPTAGESCQRVATRPFDSNPWGREPHWPWALPRAHWPMRFCVHASSMGSRWPLSARLSRRKIIRRLIDTHRCPMRYSRFTSSSTVSMSFRPTKDCAPIFATNKTPRISG